MTGQSQAMGVLVWGGDLQLVLAARSRFMTGSARALRLTRPGCDVHRHEDTWC